MNNSLGAQREREAEPETSRSADTATRAIAAYGLPGAPGLPSAPLDDVTWRQVVRDATLERAIPLLAIAIGDGALPATPEQQADASRAHEQAMRRCLVLDRALLETTEALESAGIASRALKGAAVAHLDYPTPSWRAYGDVDVLVTSDQLDAALAVLVAAGGKRTVPEIHPGFDRRFGKGACVKRGDAIQIDVHRTFVAGPFGLTIDLGELNVGAVPFVLGDRTVMALDRESRFLHACYHAALGDSRPRLTALRDVAQLALADSLAIEIALDRARAWRADGVVARAVRLSWHTLGLPSVPLSRWALSHRPDRFQTRALRAYTSDARSYATQTAAGVAAISGLGGKAAYVRALVFADRGHVNTRDGSYVRRIRRGWRAFRSTVGPNTVGRR